MACRMPGCLLMSACTHRRSLHAESTKYFIIRRLMPSLSDFCRIWVCSSIPNHQLPNSNFSSYHPSNFRIAEILTVSSAVPDKAVALLCISSAAPKSSWPLLGVSLSADNGRGDEGTGETTEMRRAGMDPLEIDEECQNRWPELSIVGQ